MSGDAGAHPDTSTLPPFDECAECFEERHIANVWREQHGLAIQPPIRSTYAPPPDSELFT